MAMGKGISIVAGIVATPLTAYTASFDYTPLAYGFVAGITVLFGILFMLWARSKLSGNAMGLLQAVAGGILAYLALETGHAAAEYVEELAKPETLGQFLVASFVTTVALASTYVALAKAERAVHAARGSTSLTIALIVALAFGVHNVAEGFAIAAALLEGAVALAVLFTVGFAVHNFTEGFGIAGPLLADKRTAIPLTQAVGLSLLAGLPVIPGAAIYYAGIESGLFLATLNTIATASIVYAMLHVNLNALAKLGGVASAKFWLGITLGVAIAFSTESLILFAAAH